MAGIDLSLQQRLDHEAQAADANVPLRKRVEAHYWVGYCYEKGTGGISEEIPYEGRCQTAIQYWQQALDLSASSSVEGPTDNTGKLRYRLAFYHGGGLAGLQRDRARAEQLYQEATPRLQHEADNNSDHESQWCLAFAHLNGDQGLPRNLQLSFRWFLASAQGGHSNAQKQVGCHYGFGWGVERNIAKAIFWLNKSIRQGDQVAIANRRAFLTGLSSDSDRETVLQAVERYEQIEQRDDWLARVSTFTGGKKGEKKNDGRRDDSTPRQLAAPSLSVWPTAMETLASRNPLAGSTLVYFVLNQVLLSHPDYWGTEESRGSISCKKRTR